MLHLQSSTSSAWVKQAVANIDTVLLDHAHCEKKAAALNLIFRYPHYTEILRPLSELAREELEHFELVLDHSMKGKTVSTFGPQCLCRPAQTDQANRAPSIGGHAPLLQFDRCAVARGWDFGSSPRRY